MKAVFKKTIIVFFMAGSLVALAKSGTSVSTDPDGFNLNILASSDCYWVDHVGSKKESSYLKIKTKGCGYPTIGGKDHKEELVVCQGNIKCIESITDLEYWVSGVTCTVKGDAACDPKACANDFKVDSRIDIKESSRLAKQKVFLQAPDSEGTK